MSFKNAIFKSWMQALMGINFWTNVLGAMIYAPFDYHDNLNI